MVRIIVLLILAFALWWLLRRLFADPETGQLLTASLLDYALPHADVFRGFKTGFDTSVPCKTNSLRKVWPAPLK